MTWSHQAPSNIALIKYMGKQSGPGNLPINPSLSYTLPHFYSTVELVQDDSQSHDRWEPLHQPHLYPLSLNAAQQRKFLQHLHRVKQSFGAEHLFFVVRSANNFPASCGMASSASSFAALTLCANQALSELTGKPPHGLNECAELTRWGSGSSCRSLISPWALWDETGVHVVSLPWETLRHDIILIEPTPKKISSSEAHQRCASSLLMQGRGQRAQQRLDELLGACHAADWAKAFELCWHEFHDMHALFSTAFPAFSYFTEHTTRALHFLRAYWDTHHDGPLVTMDAGPNIHLLFRTDQDVLRLSLQEEIQSVLESAIQMVG